MAGWHSFLIGALVLVASPGLAHARADTWLTPAPVDATAPGPSGEAQPGTFFYSEPATLAYADLVEAYTPDAAHPDRTIGAGTRLFRVDERDTAYFCSTQRLRDFGAADVPRAAILGAFGMARSAVGRDASWQCFHDSDADGRFDVVAGGAPGLASSFQFVENLTAEASMERPIAYQLVTPEPAYQIGLQFRRLPRPREGAQYVAHYCLGASGQTSGQCTTAGEVLGGVRHPFPVTIEAFGGRIVIDGVEETNVDQPRIQFRVEQRFQPGHRFRIWTQDRVQYGSVVAGDTYIFVSDPERQ